MKEILPSPLMLDLLRDSGKDCEHNAELYYDFANEVHWPLFLAFLKTNRGLDYDSLPVLERVNICIDPELLSDFLRHTPRFHHFRSRYYFYKLSLADVTEIQLFELSIGDVLGMLNSPTSEKVEKTGLLPYFKRLLNRGGKSTV